MSENTEKTEQTSDGYEKGTWQHVLATSEARRLSGVKYKKQAGQLLWRGAKEAINGWDSATDTSAENLSAEVQQALGGAHRKGDASKVKTVAIASAHHGLDVETFDSLAKAYAEAVRLTKTVKVQREEDDAAEAAIESIEAPKTASTPEAAAKVLLSKGVDGAVVAILDALGAKNEAAHRSFMRAVSTEIAARVQANKPKAAPKKKASATEKKGAAKPAPKKAEVKEGATKAKAKAKAVPVSKSKGDPNKKALPVKREAEQVEVKPKAAPVIRR